MNRDGLIAGFFGLLANSDPPWLRTGAMLILMRFFNILYTLYTYKPSF
jgi:hypothetical protein